MKQFFRQFDAEVIVQGLVSIRFKTATCCIVEILVQVPFCCSLLGGGPIVLSYLKWSEVIRKSIFCTYCDITGETTELLSTYRNKLLKQPIIYSAAPAAFKPRFFTKVVNRKSVRATLLYATRINLLPPIVLSKQQTHKPSVTWNHNQFLCLWFLHMAFSLRNGFSDISHFISHEENIPEFLLISSRS